jgi:hypothetical protein
VQALTLRHPRLLCCRGGVAERRPDEAVQTGRHRAVLAQTMALGGHEAVPAATA